MKTIDTNADYTVGVDAANNRIHIEVNGFWKEVPAHYLLHLEQAIKMVKSGFTVLADLTRLKTPPQQVSFVHVEAQKLLLRNGLSKTAELRSEKKISRLAARKWSSISKQHVRVFEDYNEAIAWLS